MPGPSFFSSFPPALGKNRHERVKTEEKKSKRRTTKRKKKKEGEHTLGDLLQALVVRSHICGCRIE